MRATGPESPLGPNKPLPIPKFKVGDKAVWAQGSNRKYFEKQFLRHLIKKWRKVGHRGRSRPIGRLDCHTKNLVRSAFLALHNASEVEIIGIVAHGMQNEDYAGSNQCYIAGVTVASSPVEYLYQLLVRWRENNNTLAMFTGIPVANDRSLQIIN